MRFERQLCSLFRLLGKRAFNLRFRSEATKFAGELRYEITYRW